MEFYSAARAPDQATCEFHLNKVKALNAVAGQKIAEIPRHTWAMYATRGNVVWDQVTSNISETTNHMITADVSQHVSLGFYWGVGGVAIRYRLPVRPSCSLWMTSGSRSFYILSSHARQSLHG